MTQSFMHSGSASKGTRASMAFLDKPVRQAAQGGEFFNVPTAEKLRDGDLDSFEKSLVHVYPRIAFPPDAIESGSAEDNKIIHSQVACQPVMFHFPHFLSVFY